MLVALRVISNEPSLPVMELRGRNLALMSLYNMHDQVYDTVVAFYLLVSTQWVSNQVLLSGNTVVCGWRTGNQKLQYY